MTNQDLNNTQQLVRRIHGGDQDAFNLLFMRYAPRIKLLVKLRMLDKLKAQVEVDDIVQEIYFEVYRNFHKFEYSDPESFYKWVITVTSWKIKDFDKYYFKTAKRPSAGVLSLDQKPSDSTENGPAIGDMVAGYGASPSQIVMKREGYQMLERAVVRLPVHFRQVIQLRQIEERTARETAEILGTSANAVNVLYHRAQERLHELLREMSWFN
ncbi:MAG: sigma-70 family RNA polymerase sigma factor [Planctomycetes bacterium]|nr:sigma-70 family RNA polymerase sigma factor [Planctomycetota bacterium]